MCIASFHWNDHEMLRLSTFQWELIHNDFALSLLVIYQRDFHLTFAVLIPWDFDPLLLVLTLMRRSFPTVWSTRSSMPIVYILSFFTFLLPMHSIVWISPATQNKVDFLGKLVLFFSKCHPCIWLSLYREPHQVWLRDVSNVAISPLEPLSTFNILGGMSFPFDDWLLFFSGFQLFLWMNWLIILFSLFLRSLGSERDKIIISTRQRYFSWSPFWFSQIAWPKHESGRVRCGVFCGIFATSLIKTFGKASICISYAIWTTCLYLKVFAGIIFIWISWIQVLFAATLSSSIQPS